MGVAACVWWLPHVWGVFADYFTCPTWQTFSKFIFFRIENICRVLRRRTRRSWHFAEFYGSQQTFGKFMYLQARQTTCLILPVGNHAPQLPRTALIKGTFAESSTRQKLPEVPLIIEFLLSPCSWKHIYCLAGRTIYTSCMILTNLQPSHITCQNFTYMHR